MMRRFFQSLLARRQHVPSILRGELQAAAFVAQGAPESLHLETGTFPVMRGVCYSVSRGMITRVRHGDRSVTCRRKPEPEEWRRFWFMVERLGVGAWWPDYQKPRRHGLVTLDGRGWRFRMRDGTLHVHSCGRGAYPATTRPHLTTDSPAALDTLQAELDRLVEGGSALVVGSPFRDENGQNPI